MMIEIARRDVLTAAPQDSVSQLIDIMARGNVGSVIIVERQRPVGIVTDRDLLLRLFSRPPVERGWDLLEARQVMTTPVRTVREDEGLERALELMQAAGVRRLPVVDRSGRLQAVVTLDDVLEALTRDLRALENVLRRQRKGPQGGKRGRRRLSRSERP